MLRPQKAVRRRTRRSESEREHCAVEFIFKLVKDWIVLSSLSAN